MSSRHARLLKLKAVVLCVVYQIKLGTADQTDADKEWVAKPYLHTAKKKKYL